MNLSQIAIFLLEGTIIATLFLFFFRIRKRFGLGMLYACLGLFQLMQVFLSSTIYVELFKNFIVSPGSAVMFTGSLFPILLIYIKEGAEETRKIIYTLVIINIVMAMLMHIFQLNLKNSIYLSQDSFTANFFEKNAWVFLIGTVALLIDSILIIILYEFLSRHILNLFFRISITLVTVTCIDSIIFYLGSFWRFQNINTILFSGLVVKGFFALFYSTFVYFYLKHFEKDEKEINDFKFKDFFSGFSYKQKYEVVNKKVEKAIKEIQERDVKYRTLTTAAPVGIFHTTVDGFTTYVNPKWCEISGVSESEAMGNEWLKAVYSEDREIVIKNWESKVSKGIYSDAEYRFLHKDGTVRYVLGHAVPECNNKSEVIGYIGTITDITELKLYELEQIRLKVKAEQSDKLKTAFLANISHEIRTPMNSILGFNELLINMPELTTREKLMYMKLIEKSGKELLNLLTEIINASKIQAGLEQKYLEEVNVNELIESLYQLNKEQAEEKGLDFNFSLSLDDEKAVILTDKVKLLSALKHLVNNAVKYCEKGNVLFGYIIPDSEMNIIKFFVKDTGAGIPIENQQSIFEPFVQYDLENLWALNGTGLGLAITKSYIEMLGGKIWLESQVGVGSTFYFTLKLT